MNASGSLLGDRPHPSLISLDACELPLDRLLDDYVRRGNLPRDALDSFKAALGAGRLQGWVAVADGQAKGLVAYAPRDTWGQISLLHAPGPSILVQSLVAQAVANLRSEGLTSIVAIVHRPTNDVRDALLAWGFTEMERQEMVVGVGQALPSAPTAPGYELVPWQPRFRDAAARVMWQANRGLPDALLYPPLQTLEGCRDLVSRITTGRWGRFLPGASPMALHARGDLAGFLLAERTARRTGYVLELAVSPAHQRAGLGRALVTGCLAGCQAAGLSALALSVSLQNAPAMGLYRALGFRPTARFSAFVWQRQALRGEAGAHRHPP